MTRTLSFAIPAAHWLSSNQRLHWAAKAKHTAWLRTYAAKEAGDCDTYTRPVRITAHIGYPSNGRADPNNAAPTTKALIDGLVESGLLVDDSHEWVLGPDHRRDNTKSPRGYHTVRLEIEEIH